MPSFDVVSEIDKDELKNAVDNAIRDVTSRFDFRGVEATIEQKDLVVTLKTESEFQVRQLEEIFRNACIKRGISAANADISDKPIHSGKTYSLVMTFKQGIEQPKAKEMIKFIKDGKFKVQVAIQGDKLRVTGKKRDDLQEVMAGLRKEDFGLALQFENFRD
ncbi:MAG: YajQ family cyclic di-GMP-binding protein [Gammaproteobacteria bacterium]|nr:YajQ family cyclic di-GMP-binding protein [Gammaproteobacteria bacterium]